MSNRSKALRQAVFERDNGRCRRCGKELYLNKNGKEKVKGKMKSHMHHIIQRCEGGKDELNNLMLTCWPCETEYHRNKEDGQN